MSDAPRRRGRPQNAETEALVLDAAGALWAEVGFDAASIEAIATRAGVAKTGIYRRWPNKGILMYHAVLGRSSDFASIPQSGDIVKDLTAVLLRNAAGIRDDRVGHLIATLVAESRSDPRLATLLREQFFGPRSDAITERVRRAVAQGELDPAIDAELVPALLTGPLQYLRVVRDSSLDEPELRRIVLAVVAPHLRR